MKTIQTTDNMTWELTESRSIFGNWIISDKIPNILSGLQFPESYSKFRKMWEIARIYLWYFTHLGSLVRILGKLPEKIRGNKESLSLGDQIMIEVYRRLQLLGHWCAAIRSRGLKLKYSDELEQELQVLCSETKMGDGVCFHTKCFSAPGCDYIQHLISSGNLDEIGNDCKEEDITHIQLILCNEKKGIEFPLMIIRRVS